MNVEKVEVKEQSEESVDKKGNKPFVRRYLQEELKDFFYFVTHEVPRTLIWFVTTNLKMGTGILGVWLVTYPIIRLIEKTDEIRNEYLGTAQTIRGLLMMCVAIYIFIKFCPYHRKDRD